MDLEPLQHRTVCNLLRERPGQTVLRQIQSHQLLKFAAEPGRHDAGQVVHGQIKNLQLLQPEEGFRDDAAEPRALQEQPPEAAHPADLPRQLGLEELVPGQVQEVQAGEVAEQRRVEHAGEQVSAEVEHLEAAAERGEARGHLPLDAVAAEVERHERGEQGELLRERAPEGARAEVERGQRRAPREFQRDGLVEAVGREAQRDEGRHAAERGCGQLAGEAEALEGEGDGDGRVRGGAGAGAGDVRPVAVGSGARPGGERARRVLQGRLEVEQELLRRLCR